MKRYKITIQQIASVETFEYKIEDTNILNALTVFVDTSPYKIRDIVKIEEIKD